MTYDKEDTPDLQVEPEIAGATKTLGGRFTETDALLVDHAVLVLRRTRFDLTRGEWIAETMVERARQVLAEAGIAA